MEFLILWGLCGFIGGCVASSKGNSFMGGFFVGLILGPIGWIISALMSGPPLPQSIQVTVNNTPELKVCPYCAEQIKAAATICRFCDRKVK